VEGWARIEVMKKLARQEVGGRHRAALDVEYLIQLYKLANATQGG